MVVRERVRGCCVGGFKSSMTTSLLADGQAGCCVCLEKNGGGKREGRASSLLPCLWYTPTRQCGQKRLSFSWYFVTGRRVHVHVHVGGHIFRCACDNDEGMKVPHLGGGRKRWFPGAGGRGRLSCTLPSRMCASKHEAQDKGM